MVPLLILQNKHLRIYTLLFCGGILLPALIFESILSRTIRPENLLIIILLSILSLTYPDLAAANEGTGRRPAPLARSASGYEPLEMPDRALVNFTPLLTATATTSETTSPAHKNPEAASGAVTQQDVASLNIWYGLNQRFGHLGNPQQWVNIPGNVSPSADLASLTYSLNGGPAASLSIGPDDRRLALPGDFNIELDYTKLLAGPNQVIVTATDNHKIVTATFTQSVNPTKPTVLYLPLILENSLSSTPPQPDLVIESLIATGNGVQITLKNQGTAPVTEEFWVDFYVNPIPPPTGVNQVWNDGRSTQGAVWGVTAPALPLGPGQTITLTIGDAYYHPNLSNFPGALPTGVPVYAQVDSANTNTNYGAVLESDESNNIIGPVSQLASTGQELSVAPLSGAAERPASAGQNLPPR